MHENHPKKALQLIDPGQKIPLIEIRYLPQLPCCYHGMPPPVGLRTYTGEDRTGEQENRERENGPRPAGGVCLQAKRAGPQGRREQGFRRRHQAAAESRACWIILEDYG